MADFFIHNMKNNDVRVQTTKDGQVQLTVTIPSDAVAKADEWAARLGSTREEVILRNADDDRAAMAQEINEFCLHAWPFPTRKAAEAYRRREGYDRDGAEVVRWRNGGWGVDLLTAWSNR